MPKPAAYATLPPLPIGEKDELVNEGTGAMRAYHAMLYGEESSDAKTKENWKRLLLQYCELDTMAMVIIFEHWWRMTTGTRLGRDAVGLCHLRP